MLKVNHKFGNNVLLKKFAQLEKFKKIMIKNNIKNCTLIVKQIVLSTFDTSLKLINLLAKQSVNNV